MTDSAAEAILAAAAKRFGHAEVFEESSEAIEVSFEDNRLKEITTVQVRGIGLRVIHKGRVGFASTTDLRDPARLVEMAGASAEFGDEARFAFPAQPAGLRTVPTRDDAVPEVAAERLVEMGREGLEMSRKANDAYLYGCGVSRSVGTQRIVNTAGLDVQQRATDMSASVGIQEITDAGFLQVYEFKDSGHVLDSVVDLTEATLEKMRQASVVVPARLEAMPMIFTPKALGNLLSPLSVALNGKNVHKGSSVLRGRLGEQVLDPRITITDDPTVPFAPGTRATDDEGLPARRTHMFERGVLRAYRTDLQTAALLGIAPGANAARDYSSRPSPASSNVVVAPGDTSLDQMIAGMKRGIIIDQTLGSGQSNVLAGEFSVNLDLGFLVEDGRIIGRVKDCMVAGNVYEVLKEVLAIGSEPRWLGGTCAPPIMVGGLKLAAQG
jgi:PmbA protein